MGKEKVAAWVRWNELQAQMVVMSAGGDGPGRTIVVLGQHLYRGGNGAQNPNFRVVDPNDFMNCKWAEEIVLPGMSMDGIVHAINNPRAKHASFSKTGNTFSRIASLVQSGYQFTNSGAVQPQHSNVVFKWTGKDLSKYCRKWIKAADKGGVAGMAADRESARELPLYDTLERTTYYYFVDDTSIKMISATEGDAIRAKEAALRQNHQYTTGKEWGKRGINF